VCIIGNGQSFIYKSKYFKSKVSILTIFNKWVLHILTLNFPFLGATATIFLRFAMVTQHFHFHSLKPLTLGLVFEF